MTSHFRARQEEDRISCENAERRRNSSNASNTGGPGHGESSADGGEVESTQFRNAELVRMEEEQRRYEERQSQRQRQRWMEQQRMLQRQLMQSEQQQQHRREQGPARNGGDPPGEGAGDSGSEHGHRQRSDEDGNDPAENHRESRQQMDTSDVVGRDMPMADVSDFIPEHLLSESTSDAMAEMFGVEPGMSVDLEVRSFSQATPTRTTHSFHCAYIAL